MGSITPVRGRLAFKRPAQRRRSPGRLSFKDAPCPLLLKPQQQSAEFEQEIAEETEFLLVSRPPESAGRRSSRLPADGDRSKHLVSDLCDLGDLLFNPSKHQGFANSQQNGPDVANVRAV